MPTSNISNLLPQVKLTGFASSFHDNNIPCSVCPILELPLHKIPFLPVPSPMHTTCLIKHRKMNQILNFETLHLIYGTALGILTSLRLPVA